MSRQALRGGGWQIAGGAWQAVLRLGASVVLARVLAPEAFGVLGMVLLICGLAGQLVVGSIVSGVIAKKRLEPVDTHAAFTLVALLQGAVFAAVFALAPVAESLTQTPGLAGALRLGSVTLLTAALGMAPTALLSRAMRFRAITAISALGVAVEMTLATTLVIGWELGAIGLIWAYVMADALMAALKIVAARWRPVFGFHKNALRYFVRFGAHQITTNGAAYLIVNADQVLIGVILGPQALGLYLFALRLPNLVYTRLAMPASGVVLPSLSRMGDDAPRVFLGYAKSARYLALGAFPLLAGLALLADPLVHLLWGDGWSAAVTPMRCLCAAAAIRTVACCCGSVFLCLNQTDLLMKLTLVKLPIFYALVGVAASLFGLNGAAMGVVLGCSLITLDLRVASRLAGVSLRQLASNLWPPCAAAAACGCVAMTVDQVTRGALAWPAPIGLTLAALAGATAYLSVLRVAFPQTLHEVRALIVPVATRSKSASDRVTDEHPELEAAA
jgi:PST family polysaccharide transporter